MKKKIRPLLILALVLASLLASPFPALAAPTDMGVLVRSKNIASFAKVENGQTHSTVSIVDNNGTANSVNVYTKSQLDTALSGKAATATTLAGYGITDAKIETVNSTNKKITLGSNNLTFYAWALGATKPSYNFSDIGSTPTTLAGYGITDAATSAGLTAVSNLVVTAQGTSDGKVSLTQLTIGGNAMTASTSAVELGGAYIAYDSTDSEYHLYAR